MIQFLVFSLWIINSIQKPIQMLIVSPSGWRYLLGYTVYNGHICDAPSFHNFQSPGNDGRRCGWLCGGVKGVFHTVTQLIGIWWHPQNSIKGHGDERTKWTPVLSLHGRSSDPRVLVMLVRSPDHRIPFSDATLGLEPRPRQWERVSQVSNPGRLIMYNINNGD